MYLDKILMPTCCVGGKNGYSYLVFKCVTKYTDVIAFGMISQPCV